MLASLVEKNGGNVFSFAGVKRNHCAKQGTKVDLTLGSHSAERFLFGLVEKDAW